MIPAEGEEPAGPLFISGTGGSSLKKGGCGVPAVSVEEGDGEGGARGGVRRSTKKSVPVFTDVCGMNRVDCATSP